MFNFSHNNYIKYGWGNDLYGYRKHSKDKFWTKYGKCTQVPLDFRKECIRAAKLIYESTEKRILVHFSGGIDSEIICRSFLEAKLPFDVCIWRYADNINYDDIKYAIKFCNEYNIKYTFFDIDILKFILHDVFDIFKDQKFFCHYWWSNISKYVISKMDGYHILGDGHLILNHDPLGIERENKPSYIPPILIPAKYYQSPPVLEAITYKTIAESHHSEILSYMDQIDKVGCTGFFQYTPELLMSYAQDEFTQNWLRYCNPKNIDKNLSYPSVCLKTQMPVYMKGDEYLRTMNANGTLNIKQHIQYKHWPEMELRGKHTGIDIIRPIRMKQSEEFGKKYHHNSPGNEVVAIPADEFIRDLDYGDTMNKKSTSLEIVPNKTAFVQFYICYPDERYELINGFSDTWDFCKSKGEMVWVPWEVESSFDFYNMTKDKFPKLNLSFSKGTVYVSCSFSYQLEAVYEWAKTHPQIKFIVGGPGVLSENFGKLDNLEIFKGSVEEYFGIDNFSYNWKVELPKELEKINMKYLRYNYKIQSDCYWGKCIYCRYDRDLKYIHRRKTKDNLKTKFNRISNADSESIIIGIPSVTKEIMKDFLVPLELDHGMSIKLYMRPDKMSYLASKIFFPLIKNKRKIVLVIAPEFLSDRMFRVMKKGTTVEYALKLFKLCDKHGIKYYLNFIVGWPQLKKEDVDELEKNIKKVNRNAPLSLFMLYAVRDHSVLSKQYPPPEGELSWMPIVDSSDDVIGYNIRAMNILKGHFNRLVSHQNFDENFLSDILLKRRTKHIKGTIDHYRGYDRYCSIVRNKNIEEMFGSNNPFYHDRNLAVIDMLKEIDNPRIFEFAATYGFLALQIKKHIKFEKYTTSNFLSEVILYMENQNLDGIDIMRFDANGIINTDLSEYNTFICTSLEHLGSDIEIVKSLPSNCNFIFSVPNFDDITHFRTFQNEKEIINRYGNILNIEKIKIIEKDNLKKFIVKSTKKI